MMILTYIGLVAIVGCTAVGVYVLAKSISFKPTVERYRYVETYDEEGNQITKVIDLMDPDNRQ